MQNKNEITIRNNDTHNLLLNANDSANISATTLNTININTVNPTTSNTFSKKIGRTMYNVQIIFSKTNKECFNDKLLRLIKNDIANWKRLPNRQN